MAIFEVGAFFHEMPDRVAGRSAVWIIRNFQQVLEYRKREALAAIMTVEVGVSRAMFPMFAGKPAPPLGDRPKIHKPEWMQKFEEANKK